MNKQNDDKGVSIVLFGMYLAMLIYFLFFAESMGRVASSREYSYNLVPFKEISRFIKYADRLGPTAVWLNLFGNVAAFVPFGYFVQGLIKNGSTCTKSVLLTVAFSFGVELIQLLSRVGSFDVDDIILNTIGGLIGSVVCIILKKYKEK